MIEKEMEKIESNIPIPQPLKIPRKPLFMMMKIGDSIYIPDKKIQSIGSTLAWIKKRHKWNFTSRREATGIRIWRTG
jgi:hypothetical protein